MSPPTRAEGRCLCAAVTFRATGEPLWIGYCHCRSCRLNTASVVATFVGYRPRQVEFPGRQRSFYESSPGVRRGFCERCGTPLSYESDRHPDEIHLYVASLSEPERFRPTFHVFHAEKIDWFETADDLPRHAATSSS